MNCAPRNIVAGDKLKVFGEIGIDGFIAGQGCTLQYLKMQRLTIMNDSDVVDASMLYRPTDPKEVAQKIVEIYKKDVSDSRWQMVVKQAKSRTSDFHEKVWITLANNFGFKKGGEEDREGVRSSDVVGLCL